MIYLWFFLKSKLSAFSPKLTLTFHGRAGRASYVRGGAAGKEDAGARAVANIFLSLAQDIS